MTALSFDDFARHREILRDASTPRRAPVGPELRAVLARYDDRLLDDIGLSRADILGPDDAWRAERAVLRGIWNL